MAFNSWELQVEDGVDKTSKFRRFGSARPGRVVTDIQYYTSVQLTSSR